MMNNSNRTNEMTDVISLGGTFILCETGVSGSGT